MKLQVHSRECGKKSDPKKNRRQGQVPAILYGAGKPSEPIYVQADELQTLLRKVPEGRLATTVFSLQWEGKEHSALLKEVQYQPVTYAIEHLDFALLTKDRPIQVNVPIQIHGVADCVGIKLGGFLRWIIRSVKVRCLPKDLPREFVIDVKEMNISDAKRLGDLKIPKEVRPLAALSEVVVVIAKKSV